MVDIAVIGSAYVVVHADTKAVRGEIERAFSGLRSIADDAGEQFAQDFADSFGRTLGDEFADLIPDTLRQDVTRVAEEAAADYADQFTENINQELSDVIARTLADDSDGLQRQGELDAGAYATGFTEALQAHFSGLLPELIQRGTDMHEEGSQHGTEYLTGFSEAVGGGNVAVGIDQNAARQTAAVAGAVLTSQLADSLDEDSGGAERAATALGARLGGNLIDGVGGAIGGGGGLLPDLPNLFGSPEEIRAASASVTQLIGLGNLIGPAIAQAVAGISALAEGLFAVGAAAAQATPSLVVLPSLLGALLQGGLATAVAFNGMGAAIKTALSPDATAQDLADDLKNLTPAAQDFVLALQGTSDEFTKLREVAQEGVFQGLDKSLTSFVDSTFPLFRDILRDTTAEINELAKTFEQTFTDPGNLQNFATVAETNAQSIGVLGRALIELGAGFNSALAAASPLIDRFTLWISTVSSGVSSFLQVQSASGQLTDTFQRAGDVAAQLGEIFSNLTGAIFDLGKAAAPAGQTLLDSFENATANLRELTQEALASGDAFTKFGQIAQNFRAIGNLFNDIGKAFLNLGSNASVEQTFTILREAIPAVESIVTSFTDAGPALAELVVSVTELVDTFTETAGITIFLEVLTAIFDTLRAILELPVFSQILTLLIPIVATSRAIQFFWNSLKFIFIGLVGPISLAGQRVAAFGIASKAALASGATGTAALTAGYNAVATSATRATVATRALATSTGAVAVASGAAAAASATSSAAYGVGALSSILAGGGAAGQITKVSKAAALAAKGMTAWRFATAALVGVPLGATALAWTGGLAALAVPLYVLWKRQQDYNASVEATAKAFVETTGQGSALRTEILTSSAAWETYSRAVGTSSTELGTFRAAVNGSDTALAALKDQLADAQAAAAETAIAPGAARGGTALYQQQQQAAAQIDGLIEKIQEEKAAADEAARAAGFLDAQHQRLAASAQAAAIEFDQVVSAFDSQVDSAIESRLATARVAVGLRDLRVQIGDLQTRGGRLTNQGFLDFTSSFNSMRDLSNELASLGRTQQAEKALLGVRDSLKSLRAEGEISRKEYEKLINMFNLTPRQIDTRVTTTGILGAEKQLADLEAQRAAITDPSSPAAIILDAKIEKAEEKLRGLEKEWEAKRFDPKEVEIQTKASTEAAEREVEEAAKRSYPEAEIFTKAETDDATKKITAAATRNYPDAQVKAAAETGDAIGDIINKVSNRGYPDARVTTEANTDPAVNEIGRVTGKAYSASVRVTADTSLIASQVSAAVAKASAAIGITVNANGPGLATGGILSGYSPGRDIIPAMLSPGEAVLRPQAVRAIGPGFINALNKDWNRVAKMLRDLWKGNATGFATGGIVGTGPTLNDFSRVANSIIAADRDGGITLGSTKTDVPLVGDTYIINPSPGMDEVELAAVVSRRQAFVKRRGT